MNGKKKGRRALSEWETAEEDPRHDCDKVCGRKLSCGIHVCERPDHKGPCGTCLNASFDELICHCGSTVMLPPIPCGTVIDCRHPCIRPSTCGHPQMPHACHEEPNCPPCPFLVQKRCACGKKEIGNQRCSGDATKVSCGLPCGKDKKLKCTDACTIAARNQALADALGIEKREMKKREVEYDPLLLGFYAANIAWCTSIEAQLTEFIADDKPSLHFPVMKRPQRQFVHELTDYFELRSESLDEEPRRSVVVHRQSNSAVPTPTLAEAANARKSAAGTLSFGALRKALPEVSKNNALYMEKVLGYSEDELREMLRPALGFNVFELSWVTDEDVLVTFATTPIDSALARMERSVKQAQEETWFCASVEAVHVSDVGQISRPGWTVSRGSGPAASTSTSASSSRSSSVRPLGTYTNAFAALGGGAPVAPAPRAWGSPAPPAQAKVQAPSPAPSPAPAAAPSRPVLTAPTPLTRPITPPILLEEKKERTEPVPDSWEEEADARQAEGLAAERWATLGLNHDLISPGEATEAAVGEHRYPFVFSIPHQTDMGQSAPKSFWIGSLPGDPGDTPDPVNVAVEHFSDTLGPLRMLFTSPYLTPAAPAFLTLSFPSPLHTSEILSINTYITQSYTVQYASLPPQSPLLLKDERVPLDHVSFDSSSSSSSRAPRIQEVKFQRTTLQPGKEWKYKVLLRLPTCDTMRATGLGSTSTIMPRHKLGVEVTYGVEGRKMQKVLRVEKDIQVSSCICLLDSLLLPSYTSAPPTTQIKKIDYGGCLCMCDYSLKEVSDIFMKVAEGQARGMSEEGGGAVQVPLKSTRVDSDGG
ncbi:transcriptional repressor NF-X1 [Pseudohyphozyma bogoriensis]|nr:transcriptional repressor NF-X1 [Pseudohyphozyma bogoriensis]